MAELRHEATQPQKQGPSHALLCAVGALHSAFLSQVLLGGGTEETEAGREFQGLQLILVLAVGSRNS